MMGFPFPLVIKIKDIPRLRDVTGLFFLVFLMADEPLPALLTGCGLRENAHLDKPAFVGAPAHKGMAPGKAVGPGKFPVLCFVSGSFPVADLLDGNGNDILPGTGCIGRTEGCNDPGNEAGHHADHYRHHDHRDQDGKHRDHDRCDKLDGCRSDCQDGRSHGRGHKSGRLL